MHVQSHEHGSIEQQGCGQITFKKNIHKAKDKMEDHLLPLLNQLVDQDAKDVGVDDRIDAIDELGQVDQACVGVVTNLRYIIIEEIGHDRKRATRDDGHTALLSVRDLQNGARGQLSDHVIFLTAAVDEAHQDARVQRLVKLVGLMEVFIDLNKHFLPEDAVVSLHLPDNFV